MTVFFLIISIKISVLVTTSTSAGFQNFLNGTVALAAMMKGVHL